MHVAENILKYGLQNVYFLVGTACGGKTTMGRALAKQHGYIYYSDNWNEDGHKVWQSIVSEKYQPNTTQRKTIDWEAYFSRPVEAFLADQKDNHGSSEYVSFSIIELIKQAQHNRVIADIWIDDFAFLTEISDHSRIACLLAPGELIIRDYYQREDHIAFTNCIQSLKNPEAKFETQNELFRIGAKKMAAEAEKYGLFHIMRHEDSTIAHTMAMLEGHFNF